MTPYIQSESKVEQELLSSDPYAWRDIFPITADLAEHEVYLQNIEPLIAHLPENVRGIWFYGFTEMFNNAIDHSEGTTVYASAKWENEGLQVAI